MRSADYVWQLFFRSNSTVRPFGEAVLDGIDLFQRTNEKGYLGFAQRMRQLMDQDTSKPYYISGWWTPVLPNVRRVTQVSPQYPQNAPSLPSVWDLCTLTQYYRQLLNWPTT